jgi:hypothetical protein
LIVDPQDEVLLAQDGQTKVLAIETLLAGTQPLLTLAPNQLLGRAGYFPGGPEVIQVGGGLVLEGGTLTADATAVAFLDSPDLTGNPTAPTPPNGDSSDAIATTAFVQANLPRVVIDGDLTGEGSGTVNVTLPSVVQPGTYTGVTVNTKGLVVSGSTLTAANVESALGFTPYNATNPASYTTAAALDTYPVLAYGAYFDGVHDDAPGINAAIAAANAAGGGTVLLPAGRGLLGSTLLQQQNNIHIVGAGVANISHNTQPSYDVGTVLSWIGAVGGTMAVIAPPQNLVNGRSISNADVRGVMFDCAATAGTGVVIGSVNYSTFDIGYYQPLVCGVKVTTVLLQAQTSATAATYEVNDTQHNTFRVAGFAVFYGATTLTAAASGATTIPVASTANFVVGQQIRVGSGLYLVAAVGANNLMLTAPLATADGASGTAVGAAPRGVWLQGLTTADFPQGYYGPGGNVYPQLWNGNISLNRFERVNLLHYNNGYAFTFGYSDHNYVDMLNAYTLASGIGLIFDGSNGLGQQSGWNQVAYCSTGTIVARGLTTFPNTSGTPANNGQYVSVNNFVGIIDTSNGTQYPTIEPGATMTWNTDTDVHLGAKLVTPTIFEAAWEPTNGTFVADPNTSLTVVNNSSDHIRLCNGLGTQSWSVNIGNAEGDLRIYPTGAATSGMLMLGSASSSVAVQGSLSAAGAMSVGGAASMASASIAGAISAGSGSIVGRMTAGTLSVVSGLTVVGTASVTGALVAPTPGASDSSGNVATTSWVSAKAYLPQARNLAALRAMPVSGFADGATVLLEAYATRGDGGSGLFTWNASSTATDNGGTIVQPTGLSGAGRWLRQLPDGRVTPQMFGALGDGVTNDTAAFAAALATGPVIVPSATYRIANLTIPNGAWMEGGAGLGYSGDVGTTPGSGQKAAVVAPILLAVAGTTSCILNVYGCNDATLKGLFLDGGSNTPTCDGVSSGSTQIMMERVTVVRCINGLGSVTNTDLYTHVATLINCEFANNTNGISNLIDTAMIGGAVSANTIGVNLGSGRTRTASSPCDSNGASTTAWPATTHPPTCSAAACSIAMPGAARTSARAARIGRSSACSSPATAPTTFIPTTATSR